MTRQTAEPATKERPILFSGGMVKAILEGRKSMTRRVVKAAIPTDADEAFNWPPLKPLEFHTQRGLWARKWPTDDDSTDGWLKYLGPCPYGSIGDRLWVKEAIRYNAEHDNFYYSADGAGVGTKIYQGFRDRPKGYVGCTGRFMCRWASRLTLEITGVKVERLQQITNADCIAEGLLPTMRNEAPAIERFRELWEKINGAKHPWSSDCWVWVISFRRVEG